MANFPDIDPQAGACRVSENLSLLSSDDALRAGIRVTRAEFARMMGVSRQAVTDWVRSGRLTVGADQRFDPAKAVAGLLRTGDPARLRAKVLQPMADELAAYRGRIVDLEAALGQALQIVEKLRAQPAEVAKLRESLEFQEGAIQEYCELFDALRKEIQTHWPALSALPEEQGACIIIAWLNRSLEVGPASAGPMLCRADVEEEGEGTIGGLPGCEFFE